MMMVHCITSLATRGMRLITPIKHYPRTPTEICQTDILLLSGQESEIENQIYQRHVYD